jgi:hypothetical protein
MTRLSPRKFFKHFLTSHFNYPIFYTKFIITPIEFKYVTIPFKQNLEDPTGV